MISQLEMPMYLEKALPEISGGLAANNRNVHETTRKLIDFMCKNIKAHNFNAVKRCLKVADTLYDKGNKVVKNAIENVFVFSFTRIFMNHPKEKQQLLAIIPMTLYTLYIGQVCHNGC